MIVRVRLSLVVQKKSNLTIKQTMKKIYLVIIQDMNYTSIKAFCKESSARNYYVATEKANTSNQFKITLTSSYLEE